MLVLCPPDVVGHAIEVYGATRGLRTDHPSSFDQEKTPNTLRCWGFSFGSLTWARTRNFRIIRSMADQRVRLSSAPGAVTLRPAHAADASSKSMVAERGASSIIN